MSAMHPIPAHPDDAIANGVRAGHNSLGMRWTALHDAAEAVVAMAEIDPAELSASTDEDIRSFPMRLREMGEFEHLSAEYQIAELMAVMQSGMSALLTICARGQRPLVPAQVLLDEFCHARDKILALAPPAANVQRDFSGSLGRI